MSEKIASVNDPLICRDHFEDGMFLNVHQKNRRTKNAIPTVYNDYILAKRAEEKAFDDDSIGAVPSAACSNPTPITCKTEQMSLESDAKIEITFDQRVIDFMKKDEIKVETPTSEIEYVESSFDQIQNFYTNYHEEVQKNANSEIKLTVDDNDFKEKPYICPVCYEAFYLESTLAIHKKCHLDEELTCDNSSSKKDHFAIQSVPQKDKTLYSCNICEKSFSTKKILRTHLTMHTVKNPIICCKSFLQKNGLKKHIAHLQDTKKRPNKNQFTCTVCNKLFVRNNDLNKPMKIHTGKKPYECCICEKCSQKSDLNAYIKSHTCEKHFISNVCETSFSQKEHLKTQMIKHTGEKYYECNVCGKKCSMKKHLKSHMVIHSIEEPFQCQSCQKSFKLKKYLRIHLLMHSSRRPFMCNICDKSFIRNTHLNTHLKTHGGEKKFVCRFCGKSFYQKGNLKCHLVLHTKKKLFQCNSCQKSFALKKYLKSHLLTHSDNKPYKCNFCDKSFIQKSCLNKHIKIHAREKKFT